MEFPSHRTCWMLSCRMFTKHVQHVCPTPSHVVDIECITVCIADFRAQSNQACASWQRVRFHRASVPAYSCVHFTSRPRSLKISLECLGSVVLSRILWRLQHPRRQETTRRLHTTTALVRTCLHLSPTSEWIFFHWSRTHSSNKTCCPGVGHGKEQLSAAYPFGSRRPGAKC